MANWQEVISKLYANPTPDNCEKVLQGIRDSYFRYPEDTLFMLKDYGIMDIRELPAFISSICSTWSPITPVDFEPSIVNPRGVVLSEPAWKLIRDNFDLFWLEPSWPTHSLVLADSVVYIPERVTISKGLYQIPVNWWSNVLPDGEWLDIAYILDPENPNHTPINKDFLMSYYRAIIRNAGVVIYDLHPALEEYLATWPPDFSIMSLDNYRHWAFVTKLLSRIIVLNYTYQKVIAENLFQFTIDGRGIIKALAIVYLYYLNPGKEERVTHFLRHYFPL